MRCAREPGCVYINLWENSYDCRLHGEGAYVVGALGWVSDGDLRVSVAGRDVGHIPRGAFFGELTVLNGEPATATVTAVKDTQIFRIRADTLKRLCVGNRQLAALIQLSIGLDAKGKLEAANNQIANL